jgi:hypothetical protein
MSEVTLQEYRDARWRGGGGMPANKVAKLPGPRARNMDRSFISHLNSRYARMWNVLSCPWLSQQTRLAASTHSTLHGLCCFGVFLSGHNASFKATAGAQSSYVRSCLLTQEQEWKSQPM